MANQEKYAQQMQDAGVCDARGAALCATVKELPDGSFGMVLLGVKGNVPAPRLLLEPSPA